MNLCRALSLQLYTLRDNSQSTLFEAEKLKIESIMVNFKHSKTGPEALKSAVKLT